MTTQTVFKRYELKYLFTQSQYLSLLNIMKQHMTQDNFGRHTINNVYFDSPDFLLIRRSLEKPCYKEKLRVRSYGKNSENVFIELKKKYDGVVYKRRLELPRKEAYDFLLNDIPLTNQTQISKEIAYFLKCYGNLSPALLLSYEREAFYGNQNNDFRMTFDHNIRIKETTSKYYENIQSDQLVLLEVKTGMGIPSWLLDFFSQNQIFKTSFSKYGIAYQKFLLPKTLGGKEYVA